MPVKIVAVDDPNNPMVITLADYEAGRANFQGHYFLSGCNPSFGGQDIGISWATFYSIVNGFITANHLDPATVALRFVYCFDTTSMALYMRVQICTMTQVTGVPNTYSLVTTTCAWYIIENGAMTQTSNTNLYDQTYLNELYYCEATSCTAQTEQNLASDTGATLYARTDTFPWANEILAMYTANGLPGNGSINFGACSYVDGGGGSAPILYPHGTVMYLKDANGVSLLNNNNEMVIFHNKGCDMGTLCPQYCNVYIVPS